MSEEAWTIEEAFEESIAKLIQAHRTEFESLTQRAFESRGLRYSSEWMDRYYKGM